MTENVTKIQIYEKQLHKTLWNPHIIYTFLPTIFFFGFVLSPCESCLNRDPNQVFWETNTLQRRLQARELCSSSGQTDRILLSTGWSGWVGGPGPLWHAGPSPHLCPSALSPSPSYAPASWPLSAQRLVPFLGSTRTTRAPQRSGQQMWTQHPIPARAWVSPCCGPLLALDEPWHD